MLNEELFTFVNPEAYPNIITEFIDDFYQRCKLTVVCSEEFKILHKQQT